MAQGRPTLGVGGSTERAGRLDRKEGRVRLRVLLLSTLCLLWTVNLCHAVLLWSQPTMNWNFYKMSKKLSLLNVGCCVFVSTMSKVKWLTFLAIREIQNYIEITFHHSQNGYLLEYKKTINTGKDLGERDTFLFGASIRTATVEINIEVPQNT